MIPRQVSKEVKRAIKALTIPWEVEKKRDHYFLIAGDDRVCIASNASTKKRSDFIDQRIVDSIRRLEGNTDG